MTRWKAAGSAPRGVDDELWKRFRGAQDVFFGAKSAAMSEQDSGVQGQRRGEAGTARRRPSGMLPDHATSPRPGPRTATLLERWAAIGKVPRETIRPLDSRLRAVETAIKGYEDDAVAADQPGGPGSRRGHRRASSRRRSRRSRRRPPRPRPAATPGPPRDATASAATYREWLTQARSAPPPTSAAE